MAIRSVTGRPALLWPTPPSSSPSLLPPRPWSPQGHAAAQEGRELRQRRRLGRGQRRAVGGRQPRAQPAAAGRTCGAHPCCSGAACSACSAAGAAAAGLVWHAAAWQRPCGPRGSRPPRAGWRHGANGSGTSRASSDPGRTALPHKQHSRSSCTKQVCTAAGHSAAGEPRRHRRHLRWQQGRHAHSRCCSGCPASCVACGSSACTACSSTPPEPQQQHSQCRQQGCHAHCSCCSPAFHGSAFHGTAGAQQEQQQHEQRQQGRHAHRCSCGSTGSRCGSCCAPRSTAGSTASVQRPTHDNSCCRGGGCASGSRPPSSRSSRSLSSRRAGCASSRGGACGAATHWRLLPAACAAHGGAARSQPPVVKPLPTAGTAICAAACGAAALGGRQPYGCSRPSCLPAAWHGAFAPGACSWRLRWRCSST